MKNHDRRIQVAWTNNSKRIAAEIIALDQEHILNYIETISSDLSAMATQADHRFLGHLLNLASAEVKSSLCLAGNPRQENVDRNVCEFADPRA